MTAATFTTQAARPVQKGDKWSAAFKTFVTRDGATYLSASCESAPLFDCEMDAWDAAERAITVLEDTGAFPNMCELF